MPLLLLLLAALSACARPAPPPDTAAFTMDPANTGVERYHAWFGDSDGEILYFGLSAFWDARWEHDEDPTADMIEPGDHLIGRFDLRTERFLQPLRVRERDLDTRSSVWDVLVHPNGRIYYTTYFEPMGSVRADGGDAQRYPELGLGLNELAIGPDGLIYVTRYGRSAPPMPERGLGGVVVLTPDGELVRELAVPSEPDSFTAPKSVAVDPTTGEVWINTDSFGPDDQTWHETLRLAPDGTVLERTDGDPDLLFLRFDPAGRGWFAERKGDVLQLRVVQDGRTLLERDLGALGALDAVQDIQFAPDGTAVLARWSGMVHLLFLGPDGFAQTDLALGVSRDCGASQAPPLMYTAVLYDDRVYATLYCGATVLRRRLPL